MIIPVLDSVVAIVDERVQTTAFNAEQALTKDTVPVNVDAVIFWHVHDAQKAALAITDYRQAIDRVAQTSLREMIGSSMLASLLSDRRAADAHLRDEIGGKIADWGVTVRSVENPGRCDSGGVAGRHVEAGSGRARKAGACDSRFRRS
jgi:regulator of protease activity HflC (stomatin/prohibitin superfamily)